MIEALRNYFFPKPEPLPQETLDWQSRISRCVVEVDSEARGPFPMLFVTDKPGRYVGDGTRIYRLWRFQ